MTETESKEEAQPHPLRAWFGIPVCVQLAQPYIVPQDAGPAEVEFEDAEGKPYTRRMGTPQVVIKEGGNVVLAAICGVLQPDGERVRLDVDTEEIGRIRIGLTVGMITHISAIWDHKEAPRITLPR